MTAPVRFLSPAWLAALGEATGGVRPGISPSCRVVVRIDGAPAGSVRGYTVELGATVTVLPAGTDADAGADPGADAVADDGSADLAVTLDYPVAVALAQGRLNAQRALAGGRLRVSGRPERAAAAAGALVALGDVLGGLRGRTRYDDGATTGPPATRVHGDER